LVLEVMQMYKELLDEVIDTQDHSRWSQRGNPIEEYEGPRRVFA